MNVPPPFAFLPPEGPAGGPPPSPTMSGAGGGPPPPQGMIPSSPPPQGGGLPPGALPGMPSPNPSIIPEAPIDPAAMQYGTITQEDGTILLHIKKPDGSPGPVIQVIPVPKTIAKPAASPSGPPR